MNLPNYYLADSPDGALPTPAIVEECCRNVRRNRAKHLAHRSTREIVELLCEVAGEWLQPDNKYRKFALAATERRAPPRLDSEMKNEQCPMSSGQ